MLSYGGTEKVQNCLNLSKATFPKRVQAIAILPALRLTGCQIATDGPAIVAFSIANLIYCSAVLQLVNVMIECLVSSMLICYSLSNMYNTLNFRANRCAIL